MKNLSKIVSYEDARIRARSVLPTPVYDYVDGGAEDELTFHRNTEALHEISFRPRMGIWNPTPNLKTTVLGTEIAMPVLTAPCGAMRVIHPDGDVGVARAAAKAGTIYVAPTASGYTLEDIAKNEGPKWFQLYRFHSQQMMEHLVGRAQAAGYNALVVTVDSTVSGKREKDARNGFNYAWRINVRSVAKLAPQLAMSPGWVYRYLRDGKSFDLTNTAQLSPNGKPMMLTEMAKTTGETNSATWEHIAWIRENWKGNLVIKGLLTAEDARHAADAGANAVIVSNHGGRQLDGAPATIEVLPEIAAAVGNELDVLLDSGIRRGADVLKALSLGAKAVLVGRLAVWGLAIGGQSGVEHMLGIIRTDLVRTMRLLGCESVADLDHSWINSSLTK